MKKRGLICILVLVLILCSTIVIALSKTPPPPPKPMSVILLEQVESSNMTEAEKKAEIENITETYKPVQDQIDLIQEKIQEYEEKAIKDLPLEEREAVSESVINKGTPTEQDYKIETVSLPTTNHIEIKICNIGTPITDEKTLSISMMIEYKDDFVEVARIRPKLSFDNRQCALTGLTMGQLYEKFELNIGDMIKFIVDADGKFKEDDEYNNIAVYSFGSENVIDGVYRVAGPTKSSPLSPELTAAQTAVVIDEGACSDISIAGTSHDVCLLSDNFLSSKLTIDGFQDSIIHLWSWDWINAKVNDIEVETTDHFFIFTQV